MSLDPHVKMDKLKTFGTGVGVGLLRSLSSHIFSSVFNTSLGYSPLGIKNFFKVGITSGLSTMGVIAVYDELATYLKKKKKPDS